MVHFPPSPNFQLLLIFLSFLTVTAHRKTRHKTEGAESLGTEESEPLSRVRRDPILPALYLPWTTTAMELTQPGKVPQHVKDRLVATLKMLPSTWEKEIQGFHDWIPRIKAVAETLRKQRSTEIKMKNV